MVERFLGPIFEWRRTPYAMPEEQESVREALAAAMELDNDGYTIAKHLDDIAHWEDIDAELVALLDRAVHVRSEVHGLAVTAWVRSQCLQPEHGVGDMVILPGDPATVYTVLLVDHDRAVYRVCQGALTEAQLVAVRDHVAVAKPLGRTKLVPWESVIALVTAQ
jgi:hypothetical protein